MMPSIDAILSALTVVCLGALGWSYQLGNRLSIIETEYDGLKDLINQRFGEVNRRLARIERGMNGSLAHIPEDE